jgi:catechol 2,3-dioxygenase-like lactoylglutathione lyase family enzyme
MNATASIIDGGVATIFVSDMNRAVDFYTNTLGLALQFRAADHWASIDAGKGFSIGLHPAGTDNKPGIRGGMSLGLSVSMPVDQAVAALKARGVSFRGPVRQDGPMKLAFFADQDGNDLYLAGFA